MKNYLEGISEGQPLDSLQNCYLTHTTIMRHFIDSDSYDKMMVDVINDIMNNEKIVHNIKGLKRKQKLFIGEIIFMWAKREFHNHYNKHSQRVGSMSNWEYFLFKFEDAFSSNVIIECRYKATIQNYEIRVKKDKKNKNKYNVVMSEFNSWRFYDGLRLIAKYDEKNHKLNINYIEYTGGRWRTLFKPKDLSAELFKGVKKIIDEIEVTKGSKPEIICDKKYTQVYEKAKERKYLDDKKKEKYFF